MYGVEYSTQRYCAERYNEINAQLTVFQINWINVCAFEFQKKNRSYVLSDHSTYNEWKITCYVQVDSTELNTFKPEENIVVLILSVEFVSSQFNQIWEYYYRDTAFDVPDRVIISSSSMNFF